MAQSDKKGGVLELNSNMDELQKALEAYRGNAEEAINSVLHGKEVSDLAQKSIYNLMPRSTKKKGAHAVDSKSLSSITSDNLALTVAAKGKWHYLYFPDDGTNTIRHVGNQRFFERGGDAVSGDIAKRCISKLIENFESEV